MSAVPTPLFTAIDHVGVAVADLDEAIAFYRDTYGMTLAHEEVNEEQGVREAMMAVGDSGSCIQLLAPLSPESTIAKFLDRSGPGIQQMAYRVEDVDAVSAVLRERGVRLLYPEAKRGTSRSRINFIHPKDAGGILVELVEPAKDTAHYGPREEPGRGARSRSPDEGPASGGGWRVVELGERQHHQRRRPRQRSRSGGPAAGRHLLRQAPPGRAVLVQPVEPVCRRVPGRLPDAAAV